MATKKSSSKRTSPAPAIPASVRDFPMYFRGKEQSDEFARGAWAAHDAVAKIQAMDSEDSPGVSAEITSALAAHFIEQAGAKSPQERGLTVFGSNQEASHG